MNAPLLPAAALAGVPVVETGRLVLRAPQARDPDAYIAAHDDPRARWMGGNAGARAAWRTFATVTGHWALRGFGLWAVTGRAPTPASARSAAGTPRAGPSARSAGSSSPPPKAAASPARPRWRRAASPRARSAGPPPSATSTRRTPARSRWPSASAPGATTPPPGRSPSSARSSSATPPRSAPSRAL